MELAQQAQTELAQQDREEDGAQQARVPTKNSSAKKEDNMRKQPLSAKAKKPKADATKATGKKTAKAKPVEEKPSAKAAAEDSTAEAKPVEKKPSAKAAELEDSTATAKKRRRPISESCERYRAGRARTDQTAVVPAEGAGSEDNTNCMDEAPAKVQRKDGLDAISFDKIETRPLRHGKGRGRPLECSLKKEEKLLPDTSAAARPPPQHQSSRIQRPFRPHLSQQPSRPHKRHPLQQQSRRMLPLLLARSPILPPCRASPDRAWPRAREARQWTQH